MTSTLNYKGYTGTIEIDTDSERLCGQVLFIRSLIVYEADTLPNSAKTLNPPLTRI